MVDVRRSVTAVKVWTDKGKINQLIFEQDNKEIELRGEFRRNMHAEPRKVIVPANHEIVGFYGKRERDLIIQLGLILYRLPSPFSSRNSSSHKH